MVLSPTARGLNAGRESSSCDDVRMFVESAKRFLQVGYLVLNLVLWGQGIATLKWGVLAKGSGLGKLCKWTFTAYDLM